MCICHFSLFSLVSFIVRRSAVTWVHLHLFLFSQIVFVSAKWKRTLYLVCWGSCSLVIDSIWLSCLHTCGWCLLSCMTSKGGSIGWHLNSWLMFSVLGWARSAALAEFSSCHRVCAERPWPLTSSHTGKVPWCRGRSSAFIFWCPWDKAGHKTVYCFFAEPLIMCNTFCGGGLV